jgi:DNA modification methylase
VTEPYYARDGIAVYLGDCRDVLAELPKGSTDLIVTDPPYGVAFQSNRGQNFDAIAGDDDAGFVPEALALACKAMRPFRHAYVFGPAKLVPETIAHPVELVWDKSQPGMGNLSMPYAPSHERITLGVYVPSKANRRDGYGRGAARMRQGSVLCHQRPNSRGAARHPMEKPVALLRRLIESSSLFGETVLDPFVGCGSTLIAAIAEGRLGVGIELDESYAEVAAKRIEIALDYMKGAGEALT